MHGQQGIMQVRKTLAWKTRFEILLVARKREVLADLQALLAIREIRVLAWISRNYLGNHPAVDNGNLEYHPFIVDFAVYANQLRIIMPVFNCNTSKP